MTTNYAGIKLGGVQTPLTASTANSLLRDADPTIFYALDFLGAMLVTHLGARFAAEIKRAKADKTFPSGIVAYKVGYDPAPYLSQEQVKFPLLAIYRAEEEYAEHTIVWRRDNSKVNISYILPPLTPGQAEHLHPILRGVSEVIGLRIEQGMDPTYTPPGGVAGDDVWHASGLDMIRLDSARVAGYTAGGDLYFPCWIGSATIRERSDFVASDYNNFAGADVHIDLVDGPTGTTITDFIVAATDVG